MRDIIVGEIDAKRVRLARVRASESNPFDLQAVVTFERGETKAFEEAFGAFVASAPEPVLEAALAVAGPIEGRYARLTRESFIVSARHLQRAHNFTTVALLNDFVAVARGAVETPPEHFRTLVAGGGDPSSAIVVIGPDAGLGMSVIRKIGGRWTPLESEGGHQAYSPSDAEEIALLKELIAQRQHVTFEDVISEAGLLGVYRALCRLADVQPTYSKFDAVATAGCNRANHQAISACEIVARSIATFAGNACLAAGARGGVFVAGSVARALEPFLAEEAFMHRFRRRGAMTLYVSDLPIRLIRDDMVALRGLAAHVLAERAPAAA